MVAKARESGFGQACSKTSEEDILEDATSIKTRIETLPVNYTDIIGGNGESVKKKISEVLGDRMGIKNKIKVSKEIVVKRKIGKPMKSVSGNKKEDKREKYFHMDPKISKTEEEIDKEAHMLKAE